MKNMSDLANGPALGLIMNSREFACLSGLIHARCGIRLTASRKLMLESRLRKRLRCLGMSSFSEYCAYLFSPGGMRDELIKMIDEVTTNTTGFFREPGHFEYLAGKIVPEFISSRSGRRLKVWSAGCSTGEEPYTLAMVLNESFPNSSASGLPILATDICTQVLDKARLGIYEDERTASVPGKFKRKYFMINRDRNKRLVRIVPELRRLVRFRTLNLMSDNFGLAEQLDVIFCRNVIIYFDRTTQEKLIRHMCDHLSPGGHLFLGHSETLSGLDLPLVRVESTIYRKQG